MKPWLLQIPCYLCEDQDHVNPECWLCAGTGTQTIDPFDDLRFDIENLIELQAGEALEEIERAGTFARRSVAQKIRYALQIARAVECSGRLMRTGR